MKDDPKLRDLKTISMCREEKRDDGFEFMLRRIEVADTAGEVSLHFFEDALVCLFAYFTDPELDVTYILYIGKQISGEWTFEQKWYVKPPRHTGRRRQIIDQSMSTLTSEDGQ